MSGLAVRWTVLGAVMGLVSGIGLAMATAWQMTRALADFGASEETSAALSIASPYSDDATTWLALAGAPVLAALIQGPLLTQLTRRIGPTSVFVALLLDGIVGIGGGWSMSLFKSASRMHAGSVLPAIVTAAISELSLFTSWLVLAISRVPSRGTYRRDPVPGGRAAGRAERLLQLRRRAQPPATRPA